MSILKTSEIRGIDKQFKNKLLALDSMVFIYLIEQTEPYFLLCKKIAFLAESGEAKIISSVVAILECLSPVKYVSRPEIQTEILSFFENAPGLTIFSVDKDVCLEASRLRRENLGLKTPDSIQLATALINKADVFITNDARLKRLSLPGLKILSLSQIK